MRKLRVVENPITRAIPFKRPTPPTPVGLRCGCGKPAEFEVYENQQPHCRNCAYEAIDSMTFVVVRRIGGYDDAS